MFHILVIGSNCCLELGRPFVKKKTCNYTVNIVKLTIFDDNDICPFNSLIRRPAVVDILMVKD